ncbi:integrase catalytic domain-containing protein [Trichonephila inaurata madagascariensis]|uniref:Integrase catalytic domain-containing protein n=1 Tax=Trichonephila inaurata madagascariensis TaxID=2747483 RepID=A0A8X6XKM3_9ARAC|nr:integrase catalytic domain-containing protein [Trichonephila inaurata madagascariensis]
MGKFEEYQDVLDLWLSEKIIEEVNDNKENFVHYLPHRPVIKENSTSKIRPAFDASARTKGSPSLNDCLEKDPNFIEVIPTILNRFRKYKIGVISDIEKAFLQIGVREQDRDFLCGMIEKIGTTLKSIVTFV